MDSYVLALGAINLRLHAQTANVGRMCHRYETEPDMTEATISLSGRRNCCLSKKY